MRTTIVAVALIMIGCLTAVSASATTQGTVNGRFDQPQHGFAPPGTVLSDGNPTDAGLDSAPIDSATKQLAAWTNTTAGREHPMFAGAVSLLAHDGTVVSRKAAGHELRYADASGKELPADQQEPMRQDTIFDLASITKLFTSIAALQLIEQHKIELDAPVAQYLPEFGNNGKQTITVRQLLTHTSGLQAEVQLWTLPPQQRIPFVMNLKPEAAPGTRYTYSDPNLITTGVLIQRITGQPLDTVIRQRIIDPLGMSDTGYNPPASKLHRIAATEFESNPSRGMVRGQVHDENAWSLGGVSGHAGIFSTADDLAVLAQTMLNGGTYNGQRILSESSVSKMLTNYNSAFPGNAHGLGFELDQRWYMAGLSGPGSAGHTGYTGTSLVIDPASRSIAILLTNRVHPSRNWGSNNPSREALAQGMANAMAVRPSRGPDAWFSGTTTAPHPATLTTDEIHPKGAAEVSFRAFVDTQNDPDGKDPLTLEASTDGTTWQPVPVTATGPGAPNGPQQYLAGAGHRAWWQVHASVPDTQGKPLRLRWSYAPDSHYTGRGVYVDAVSVEGPGGVLLDGEHQPARFTPQGWISTDH